MDSYLIMKFFIFILLGLTISIILNSCSLECFTTNVNHLCPLIPLSSFSGLRNTPEYHLAFIRKVIMADKRYELAHLMGARTAPLEQ